MKDTDDIVMDVVSWVLIAMCAVGSMFLFDIAFRSHQILPLLMAVVAGAYAVFLYIVQTDGFKSKPPDTP